MSPIEAIVWNRACYGGGEQPREGDTSLAALLHFHGAAMNGGVFHAAEFCTKPQLLAAQNGFKYFGLQEVAALLAEASLMLAKKLAVGDYEREFAARYYSAAGDSKLSARFAEKYASDPQAFAPVQ